MTINAADQNQYISSNMVIRLNNNNNSSISTTNIPHPFNDNIAIPFTPLHTNSVSKNIINKEDKNIVSDLKNLVKTTVDTDNKGKLIELHTLIARKCACFK